MSTWSKKRWAAKKAAQGGSPGGNLVIPEGFHRGQAGFMLLLTKQGGRCAICGVQKGMELVPDHDHLSGKPRGLLCQSCNWGIGHFSDDPARLREASAYVRAWRLLHAAETQKHKRTPAVKVSNMNGWDGVHDRRSRPRN